MGALRFLLALIVIIAHSGWGLGFYMEDERYFGLVHGLSGGQAVTLFYAISGFYMALVLTNKYQGKHRFSTFYISRFFRLWPSYIVITLILGFINGSIPNLYDALAPAQFWTKFYLWFSNLFILGSDTIWYLFVNPSENMVRWAPIYLDATHNGVDFLLNPPIFTVAIEILFYLIAPFFVTKLRGSIIILLIGIIVHYVLAFTGNINPFYQYHFFPSTLVYFGTGSIAYHMMKMDSKQFSKQQYFSGLIIVLLIMFCPLILSPILLIVFAFTIVVLFKASEKIKFDKILGDISYLIYIIHFPLIMLNWKYGTIFQESSAWMVSGVSIIFALLIYYLMESPLNKLRQKWIRKRIG